MAKSSFDHRSEPLIPKSIIEAKGDIITGSAEDKPVRLPIGANGKTLRVVSGLPAWADADNPGVYARDTRLAAKSVSVAADRYTILTPNRLLVDVGGIYLSLSTQQALVLSDATIWDSTATDYTVAANRAGKDFSVYAVLYGGVSLKILISANATMPTGYTTTTSRRIGGFHCLCAAVGTISGHALSGYVAGDILPASVWDLKHRPVSSPAGMVYVAGIGKWVDIYLPSYSGGALVSAYGGIIADGTSTWGSNTGWDWYDFAERFAEVGKRMLTQAEFMVAATGSNEGTNIAGSGDPVTTGGHSDTADRRMISHYGVEDCCGAIGQLSDDSGGLPGPASFVNQYSTRTAQRGQGYNVSPRMNTGGSWYSGSACGSRYSAWVALPTTLNADASSRGLSDHISEV